MRSFRSHSLPSSASLPLCTCLFFPSRPWAWRAGTWAPSSLGSQGPAGSALGNCLLDGTVLSVRTSKEKPTGCPVVSCDSPRQAPKLLGTGSWDSCREPGRDRPAFGFFQDSFKSSLSCYSASCVEGDRGFHPGGSYGVWLVLTMPSVHPAQQERQWEGQQDP